MLSKLPDSKWLLLSFHSDQNLFPLSLLLAYHVELSVFQDLFFLSRKKKTLGRYYIWRVICSKYSEQKRSINSETHRLPDKGQCGRAVLSKPTHKQNTHTYSNSNSLPFAQKQHRDSFSVWHIKLEMCTFSTADILHTHVGRIAPTKAQHGMKSKQFFNSQSCDIFKFCKWRNLQILQ